MFFDLVYRGWQWENKVGYMESWVKSANPITIKEKFVEDRLHEIGQNQSKDPDMFERMKLIAKFYTKALSMSPSEEKYLFLWTILEVYPMKASTNIKPISETLSLITGREVQYVKDKLGIGRLYGIRTNLVHNGTFDIPVGDMGAVFDKLENIVREIILYASKLPPAHSLDGYFT